MLKKSSFFFFNHFHHKRWGEWLDLLISCMHCNRTFLFLLSFEFWSTIVRNHIFNFDSALWHSLACGCMINDQFYKGQLPDGSLIEVRCLKLNPKLLYQNLHQSLELIAKLRHCHLASILGHCITSSQDSVSITTIVHIVSEHVTNGTLRSHLTGNNHVEHFACFPTEYIPIFWCWMLRV